MEKAREVQDEDEDESGADSEVLEREGKGRWRSYRPGRADGPGPRDCDVSSLRFDMGSLAGVTILSSTVDQNHSFMEFLEHHFLSVEN